MALIRAAILAGLNTGFSGFSSLFSLELLPIVDAFSAETYTKSSRDRNATNHAYHQLVSHPMFDDQVNCGSLLNYYQAF